MSQETCHVCGMDVETREDVPGPECEVSDGVWVCSRECYDHEVGNQLLDENLRIRAEVARLEAALGGAAMYADGLETDVATLQGDLDRLRAEVARLREAICSLLACPHIADRDTDMEWGEVETEEAVEQAWQALNGAALEGGET